MELYVWKTVILHVMKSLWYKPASEVPLNPRGTETNHKILVHESFILPFVIERVGGIEIQVHQKHSRL